MLKSLITLDNAASAFLLEINDSKQVQGGKRTILTKCLGSWRLCYRVLPVGCTKAAWAAMSRGRIALSIV
jgi:hypothetical protein